jgi:ABC-type branched-subunit amino acid transport system ATPase component
MSEFVNLNETGVLSKSGQGYGANAEDQNSESHSFRGRMDASQGGLKGAAGNTFTNVADTSANNLVQLANRIVEQAVRAVRAENTLITADEDATGVQQVSVSNMDSHASAVSRPINA